MTLFIRAVAADDKAAAIKATLGAKSPNLFTPALSQFMELPGTPFAYWVGSGVRATFSQFPPVEGDGRSVRVGLQTSDDFRFLRAQWEIDPCTKGKRWFPFAKGGELSPFYASLHLVVNWHDDGKEIRNFMHPTTGKLLSVLRNIDYYFTPGLTWPLRASRFAPQPLPEGCIFSVRGYSAFLPKASLLPGLSIFNSKPFDYLFKALLGRFGYPEFIVGVLQKLPWPEPSAKQAIALSALARRAWSAARTVDTAVETSLAFTLPASLNSQTNSANESLLAELQSNIDSIVLELFNLSDEDRAEIEGASVFASAEIVESDEESDDDSPPAAADESSRFSLLSWAVGVAFGRFDIRLATGERSLPSEPEPFDALPECSPGMLPAGVQPFIPSGGIFVDDPGHGEDLVARITAVFERLGQPSPEPDALRRSLAREFFSMHLKMYTKSGRKAPIYWQLATPSAKYSVWLYLHDLHNDTFFRVQSDYVTTKIIHEQRQLDAMRADAGPNPTSSQRKAIDSQEVFIAELQAFLEDVKQVAPLWHPVLDDGVVLIMSPLWKLVPQNKAWQKELKAKWVELQSGKYDWSHTAMHLWPERVVPKCATDRSLAIAHGLEDIFWMEGGDGKWKARLHPTRPVADLVQERTSVAVKAALLSLSEASTPVPPRKKARRLA